MHFGFFFLREIQKRLISSSILLYMHWLYQSQCLWLCCSIFFILPLMHFLKIALLCLCKMALRDREGRIYTYSLNLVSNKHNKLIVGSRKSEIAMTLDFKSNHSLQYIGDFCVIQYSSGRCWSFLTFSIVTVVFRVFAQFSRKWSLHHQIIILLIINYLLFVMCCTFPDEVHFSERVIFKISWKIFIYLFI